MTDTRPTVSPDPRRGRLWPVALVALLVVSAGANLAFMLIATRDPSFAVEPDYYKKALAWDQAAAQHAHNQRLGWALSVRTEPGGRPGQLRLIVGLADAAGGPIEGATVAVEAFHQARSAQVYSGTLRPAGTGAYAAELPLRRRGLWELRFRVSRGAEVFTHRMTAELPGAA